MACFCFFYFANEGALIGYLSFFHNFMLSDLLKNNGL